jgi:hypothetical protein
MIYAIISNVPLWYILLDVFSMICFMFENALRYIATTPEQFFASLQNKVDVLISFLCLGTLITYAVTTEGVLVTSAVLAVRYVLLLFRLVTSLKQYVYKCVCMKSCNGVADSACMMFVAVI